MIKNRIAALLIGLGIALVAAPIAARAQDAPAQTALSEQEQAEEQARKDKAIALLEQVISESQALKLPENRTRIQIYSADLLWERNEARARTLFANAAAGISDMMRVTSTEDRQYYEQMQAPLQLRRELLLRVARHDAALAFQLLQATRPPSASAPNDARSGRRLSTEEGLEQMLLMQIAASDPKAALKYADEMLDKGQYPMNLATILARLQRQDKEAAAKFSDKLVGRLQTENFVASRDAITMAFILLQAGPRPSAAPATADGAKSITQRSYQVLSESAYRDLLEAVIASALKATPSTAAAARGQRGGRQQQQLAQTATGSAQNEQVNARMLLVRLQVLLPQIDQYLPARSQALRQKLAEVGMSSNGNQRATDMSQMGSLVQQNTSESLTAAAATAPPGMQSRLYQQAALRAVDEGNPERALEIANEHLDAGTRNAVLQSVSFKQLAAKAQAGKVEEVRQALLGLPSEQDRLTLLLQLATATQKENPKQAVQFLNEARNMVSRRATNYQQLDDQLRVAHSYAALEPARSFEILEPGINQLNELLPAAAMLSGFDVNIFKDGELPMQGGGSMLANMIARYGQELSFLAKSDFERSVLTADKFQLPESRILARLSIVQGVLGSPAIQTFENNYGGRGFGQGGPFIRLSQ
ncbi:MAG TPA: hypothetical protein VF735_10835 [Pyrinomonadaceae bacterium]|jgi:hypothetical protein